MKLLIYVNNKQGLGWLLFTTVLLSAGSYPSKQDGEWWLPQPSSSTPLRHLEYEAVKTAQKPSLKPTGNKKDGILSVVEV
jgi:hypothetical protein